MAVQLRGAAVSLAFGFRRGKYGTFAFAFEHCEALNPTARQFCVGCGARFNIKQKSKDAGKKRASYDSMPSRSDGEGGPPLGPGEAGSECGDGDDGGGRGYGAPRRRSSMGHKSCPASCSQANSLAQLSCSLCGAKFSVAHTSRLLQVSEA